MPPQCPPSPSGLALCSVITPLAPHLPFWSCFLRGFSTCREKLCPPGCPSSSSLHGDEGSRKSSEAQQGQELFAGKVLLCPRKEQQWERSQLGYELLKALQGTGPSSAFPSHPQKPAGEGSSFTFKHLALSARTKPRCEADFPRVRLT